MSTVDISSPSVAWCSGTAAREHFHPMPHTRAVFEDWNAPDLPAQPLVPLRVSRAVGAEQMAKVGAVVIENFPCVIVDVTKVDARSPLRTGRDWDCHVSAHDNIHNFFLCHPYKLASHHTTTMVFALSSHLPRYLPSTVCRSRGGQINSAFRLACWPITPLTGCVP